MKVYRASISIFLFVLLFGITSCADKKIETPKKEEAPNAAISAHDSKNDQSADVGLDAVIRKKTLPDCPTMTIGKAFDSYSYFHKQEWKVTTVENGKIYVDCIGWFDTKMLDLDKTRNGVAKQGVGFKFAILTDGSFGLVMVSRIVEKIDVSMNIYPIADIKDVLNKVYGNKEIRF